MTVEESRRGLPAEPATYRALFSEGQFRALFVAQAISLTGDQLARVALAVLRVPPSLIAAATAP